MGFYDVLDQVLDLLRQRERVTYRALKREFHLDDDFIEDLKEEIIHGQQLAVDEDGRVLVWTGATSATTPLPDVALPVSMPTRQPLAYTPQYLTEKILASRSALEGERKQVTVVFADMKGSTELIQGLDPEEARRLLDPALQIMMDAVHRYEGTVNQVLGDGIMALFGAPLAHEDHALRACYASLAMQTAMRRYAEEMRHTQGLEVQLRVGLNSGEVVVRAIGNDLHMDYSAVGQTTHLAARMEQLAIPEREYTSKHALTHEVAYGSLLQEQRRVLHAQIVETLETTSPDRVAEQVERLAQHALRGEVWDKALAYFRQAGERAMARSAHHEAVGYFDQALHALAHLPAQRETHEQAVDLRLALRSALLPALDSERILACLCEAEALAVTLDDHRRLGQISSFLSVHFRNKGAYEQSITAAQRALAAARGDVVIEALANLFLGAAFWAQGDYQQAIDCLRQTMAALSGAHRYERFGQANLPAVQARAFLAGCLAELGLFAEGHSLGEEGRQIAAEMAHPSSIMWADHGAGLLALRQGNLPRALPLLEHAVSICQEAHLPLFFPRMAAALGTAYTLSGRVADAVALLTQATEQTIAMDMTGFQVLCSLPLGEAQMLAGHLAEAYALTEQMLTLARRYQERGHQAYALHLLGEIAVQREPSAHTSAEADYRQAFALAEELGMRPLMAHCHLSLGTLYSRMGQMDQARAELTAAIACYRSMEMTFWLPRAEAALAQAGRV